MSATCQHCGARLVSGNPLTPIQRDILLYIESFTQANGFAPSFDEIAERFMYNSLATVHEHLTTLERKGWIRRSRNEARAIIVLHSLSAT